MKFFVKDFCETVQARVVIFGMQVDNDVLYCGIKNKPSLAYWFKHILFRKNSMYNIYGDNINILGYERKQIAYIVLLLLILPCISPTFFLSIL